MKCYKLEIFIPETHFSKLRDALQSVDAGHIGNWMGIGVPVYRELSENRSVLRQRWITYEEFNKKGLSSQ